ncbi:hypothetical protein I4U23_005889 [Adineta vaga]|nr:hypothetical protein I4U23_005889 [Adineta vaga]
MGIKASNFKSDRFKRNDSTSSTTSSSSNSSSILDENFNTFETFTLVWLDPNVDNDHNQRIQNSLREHLTFLITFTDLKICEQWLKERSKDTKIFLIVSGQFGRPIVKNIHELPSILAIYVFCYEPANHIEWAKNFPKIHGVLSKKEPLIQALSHDQILYDSIEDFKATQILKNRSQENVWYQLFLEILLSTDYFKAPTFPLGILQILRQLCKYDAEGLRLLKEFEETYSEQRLMKLFVNNTPLRRFINKALREQDISLLFNLRLFIMNLYDQIINGQARTALAYRKQLMTENEIDNIRINLNQYLVFNGFLIASSDRPDISEIPDNKTRIQTVLVEIQAQNFPGNAPFVCLDDLDGFKNNPNVLFTCGAIFKIILLKKIQDSIWTLGLELVGKQELRILNEKEEKLRKTQDFLMINTLLEQSDQSHQAKIFCENILQLIPTTHKFFSQIKEKVNSIATIQTPQSSSVSLRNTQFILLGLSKRMSQLAQAMFKALHSLTNETILIYENPSEISFSTIGNKTLMIFTDNRVNSSMLTKPNITMKLFILETNDSKVNNEDRFGSDEDLMFQLSDELYRCYQWEANEDWRDDQEIISKQKEEIAKNIHEQLTKVYENFPETNLNDQLPLSTITRIVYLKRQQNDNNNRFDKLKNLCKDLVTSCTSFDDPEECWFDMLAHEEDKTIFLLINKDYSDNDIVSLLANSSLAKVYRYSPIQTTTSGKSRDKTSFDLIYDLLEHYSKLGSAFQSRKDPKTAKEMFTKAQRLCKCLAEL